MAYPTQKNEWQSYAKQNGYNANGNNEIKPALNHLGLIYGPEAEKQAWFSNSLGQQGRSAIQSLLDSLSQGSQKSQMQGLQRGATENAANSARQASLFNAGAGLGSGYQAGNTASLFGQAANTQNDIARQYASPEHMQSVLQAILGTVNQGQQNNPLQQLLQMYPDVFSSQQYNDAQQANSGLGGVLRQIAPVASSFLSGGGLGGSKPQAQGASSPGYFDWDGFLNYLQGGQ